MTGVSLIWFTTVINVFIFVSLCSRYFYLRKLINVLEKERMSIGVLGWVLIG